MALKQISAKTLGSLALRPYCPRCSWIQLNCKLPYLLFPGIFSSIDSYTKKVVHGYFDQNNSAPSWLQEIGNITGYVEPPHYSKFQIPIEEYGIIMTGSADLILTLDDGSLCIADYKTARHSKAQDKLMPMYQVQLVGYAQITEAIGLGEVSKLALIYMEPQTSREDANRSENNTAKGFKMVFSANLVQVKINSQEYLEPVLRKASYLLNLNIPPKGRVGCMNCKLLYTLLTKTSIVTE